MPQALAIHAGPRALQQLRERGLQPRDVRVIPAAAGGPKGLVLNPLDRFLFGEWLPRDNHVVHLLGVPKSGPEALLKTCEEIDRLESDADRVMRAAMSRLFREEQDVREIIKMRAIYELLEAITDRCLDVANLAEAISLENA